jgi:hypothetical protein
MAANRSDSVHTALLELDDALCVHKPASVSGLALLWGKNQ